VPLNHIEINRTADKIFSDIVDDNGKVVGKTVERIRTAEDDSRDTVRNGLAGSFDDLRTYVNTPAASVTNALVVSTLRTVCKVLIWMLRERFQDFSGSN